MSASPFRQIALQGAAVVLVLSLAWPYFGVTAEALPWATTTLAIGTVAALFAVLSRQPWWWCAMHALFAPAIWLVYGLAIDPGWFLLAFFLLLLVYRGAVTEQVPLYLTNAQTVDALAQLLPAPADQRFLDLGAGLGSTVLPLSRLRPDSRFCGLENAPLTWLVGWLRTRGRANVDWRWGNLWAADLSQFDVVYAFLSPAPMAALAEKVQAEMQPGSLFISNSFALPERDPDQVVDVPGTPVRSLYCYRR